MRNARKAPLRVGGAEQGSRARSSRSSATGARALFGAAFGKSAPAKAAAAARAKAASAHIFALTVDHGLVAAGVAAAIGSAGFAGFMAARDNSHPLFGGVEHLMIFAQPIGGSASQQRRLLAQASTRPSDDDATGSINPPPVQGADNQGSTGGLGKGYVLRFTRKGAILVEGPKGSYAAAPGVVLPDKGRILSIQNRNGRWVVLTENGTITEPAP